MKGNPFKRANRLWFHEGRTAKALAAYGEALRAAPMDPVVAFQFARVLWSLDRFDEARFLLDQANAGRNQLSATGQRVLDRWRELLQGPPPERHYPEIPAALLDRDRLGQAPLPPGSDWLTLVDAANEREMYGLAIYALDRWGGLPIDADDAREIGQVYTNCHLDEATLTQMRARDKPQQNPGVVQKKISKPIALPDEDLSATISRRGQPISTAAGETPQRPTLPELRLTLAVSVMPVEGRIGIPTKLVATLSNPTSAALLVNTRMLVNHTHSPGEIWLDVQGPEGYRNMVGFRVRAGQAPQECFASLAPGASVQQSWALNDYESMHLSGNYVVTLTYHNEIDRAPDGRPMAVGKVAGVARFPPSRLGPGFRTVFPFLSGAFANFFVEWCTTITESLNGI